MIRPVISIALVAAALCLAGCNSPPQNRGTSGNRMDPTHDASSEIGGTTLRSGDLVEATDRMARDIASRLDITNPGNPPRIVVGEIENNSSVRNQNYQVFLARLRAQLNSSGSRYGLEFIRERQFVEQQRDREYGGKDPAATEELDASRADYVLTCEVYDLPSAGTNYFFLSYQLVQLRPATTGPNRGTRVVVWENSYEVKYQ